MDLYAKTLIGRPRQKPKAEQNRMSVSFSDAAWAILKRAKPGLRSQLISALLQKYGLGLPEFFEKRR